MLLIMCTDAELVLNIQAAARYTWHCRCRVTKTVAEAMEVIEAGAAICGAILQSRMPDGSGLDVARRIEAAAPLSPPLLMLLESSESTEELEQESLPWVRMPPSLTLLEEKISADERRALACAAAHYAEGKGLTESELELFVLEASGVPPAELRQIWRQHTRSRSSVDSALSTYRLRIADRLGITFHNAIERARLVYKLPIAEQPEPPASRGRRWSGTRLRSQPAAERKRRGRK